MRVVDAFDVACWSVPGDSDLNFDCASSMDHFVEKFTNMIVGMFSVCFRTKIKLGKYDLLFQNKFSIILCCIKSISQTFTLKRLTVDSAF